MQGLRSPANGGERRVPCPNRNRKVKRGDDPNGTQRMPLFKQAMLRSFTRHRKAIKLPRQTDGEVAHVDHLLNFTFTLAADFSRFQRDEETQILLMLPQRQSNLAHNLAALRRR